MSSAYQNIVGFVAFRKGSQRLRLKNAEVIGGKPLYQISLDKLVAMREQGLLDTVVASTDCADWADQCRRLYADKVIIHERSAAVSGSDAGEGDVIREFLSMHSEYSSHAFLLLLCTYPFLKKSVLAGLVKMYREYGKSVFSVVENHHMPQKLLKIEGNELKPYLCDSFDEFEPNSKILKERYPASFHSTGAFLVADPGLFSKGKSVWNQSEIKFFIDDSFHVDIDTEFDLKMARLYYETSGVWE